MYAIFGRTAYVGTTSERLAFHPSKAGIRFVDIDEPNVYTWIGEIIGWWAPAGGPGGGPSPSGTVTLLDGTGAAGASALYSRGDHKHGDTARHSHTNQSILDTVTSGVVSNSHAAHSDDQDLSGLVSKTTTVNGHALSGNIAVTLGDVGGAAAAHAGAHVTGGSDVIANAIPAGNAGLMTGADKTKLDGVASGAVADHLNIANKGTNTHPQIDTFIGTKGAANGLAGLDANSQVAQAILKFLASAGALAAVEGTTQWQSTKKLQLIYDGQRERAVSEMGWMPYAYPIGVGPANLAATALSLPAAGGCYAAPVVLESSMLLQSVTVRNLDTATARTFNWYLYAQYLNNGNAGENSLSRVASGTQTTFTPTVASNRESVATGAPIYLPPGVYWVVIQNQHASSTFGLGTGAAGTMALNTAQTKTITNPAPDPLDFVAATWTKVTSIPGVRLNGRVFGQTILF